MKIQGWGRVFPCCRQEKPFTDMKACRRQEVTLPQTENLPKEVENSSLAKNSFLMLYLQGFPKKPYFPFPRLREFPQSSNAKTFPNMKSCQKQEENLPQTGNLLKEVENSSLAWENSLLNTWENFWVEEMPYANVVNLCPFHQKK